ncbi:MAG: PA14 domain-containing protein, partial [Planctomycetota bacterium]|nr:PA14 domain-containing protein [Planctomycetota bacterium]
MQLKLVFVLTVVSNLAFCGLAGTQDRSHPIIPAFERFLDVDTVGEVERGTLLINELNCGSCHQADSVRWTVASKKAPVLSQIGSRVRPQYFEKFLLNPQGTKPGTTMPDVLASKGPDEKKMIAEAVAHFLASTGKTSDTPPLPGPVSNGEKLYHSIGCVACHDPQNTKDTVSTSVPLGNLAEKYTIPGLSSFLQNPLGVRPSGRMPHLGLTGQEAQEIATFLLKDIKVKSNINVAIYEGSWDQLPDFEKLKPISTGSVPMVSATVSGRSDNFGLVFTGFWDVTQAGKYDFVLSSDDGSRLVIDGKRVVDNDGIHGVKNVTGSTELTKGKHKVRIEFFEKSGGEEIKCEVSGPGLAKQSIGGLLKAMKEPPMEKGRFVFDPAKAKRGALFFTSEGCANCHEMKSGGVDRVSTFQAVKSISDLKTGGCIEGRGIGPRFAFNEKQKTSLVAALAAKPDLNPNANTKIHQKLATFNCYACHERDFVGGVVDRRGESDEVYGREKWFTSNQPEMGDEGRLPPYLNGVGAKLSATWLEEVVDNGAKERPYMATRMPKFGKSNLGSLVEEFKQADRLTNTVKVEFAQSPRKFILFGMAFAVTSEKYNGRSGVKCHTFG